MPQSVREASARIDELLEELGQSAVPAVMGRVEELLACVLALHAAGLERIVEASGPEQLRLLADDELVGNLLVLHDLHPDDVDTRVQRALDQVRPYLGSHAGGVSLSGVDEVGVVHLQLEGSCDGCPSSAMTVKSAIEDAILAAAPDVVAVEADGMVEEDPGPKLFQIEPFREHSPTSSWEHVELDVAPRTLSEVNVAGARVVVANLDGTLVAYAGTCPGCGSSLASGTLTQDVLACAGCGRAYDVRMAGRDLGDEGLHLEPCPLLPDHGAWKVSLPRGVAV